MVDTGPHGVMFEIERLVVDISRSILRVRVSPRPSNVLIHS